jgi:hypothetical protein
VLSPSGVAPALLGYFPDPSGTGVRVGSIRAERAEVSGTQVVVADQLELVIVRLVRTHSAVAGRPADGLAWAVALPVFWLAGLHVGVVFVSGLRMRVMPCRVLAHDYPPLLAVCGAGSDYLPGPTAL